MNVLHPIYTVATECQDCYKCIRGCPVKAIKVEGGYASIESERCVFCGSCVGACPNGAKKVRDDQRRVERLIASGRRVVASLAPSFASEFAGVTAPQVIGALRRLGFAAVSETALGAEEVSAHCRSLVADGGPRIHISTACPVVVEYVRKYRPEAASLLTPLLSPMLAHARLLQAEFGDATAVVFLGPCIAKKREADRHPELVEAALTFEDVRAWLDRAGVKPEEMPGEGEAFVPRAAGGGALYPIEGGMLAGLRDAEPRALLMSYSGLNAVAHAIDGLDDMRPASPVFLELLACEGGCVNGPKSARAAGAVRQRYRVLRYAPCEAPAPEATLDIGAAYGAEALDRPRAGEQQIREVLRGVGKQSSADELNCGGCGYDSCREFAGAFLMGRAERRMCVTYMRKLAEKKTHVLMQKMPSAVVLVDDALRILECNPSFVRFFGEGESALEGRALDTLAPFAHVFEKVLRTGEEVIGRDIRCRGSVFHMTVFNVEKHAVVGGIFRDETQPAVRKEQIIERARQVVAKNLETVQQIAYLLGENAAESEVALNAIIDSFSAPGPDER